jgi:hypothetical protein
MKKEGSTAPETQESSGKANFVAFPLIAAFSLSDLFVFPRIMIFVIIPLIVIEFAVIGYYSSKVKKKEKLAKLPLQAPTPPKPTAVIVGKGEVVLDVLQFSVASGRRKKHWTVVKSIPVSEISSIESAGNEVTVTWNGVTEAFAAKEKTGSFLELRNQIHDIKETERKLVEEQAKTDARKSDLTNAINTSIPIVDLSFSILIGLHEKRVNWTRLQGYAKGLGEKYAFAGQTMAPLNLDFAQVSLFIERQAPRETSVEAFNVLKSIHGYFKSLKPEEDITNAYPNFQSAKDAILAYYTLNDMLLGKVTGERENKKEDAYLEALLQRLRQESGIKVNFEDLMASLDRMSFEEDRQSVIDESRELFKEQLKNIDRPGEYTSNVPLTEQPMLLQPDYPRETKPAEPQIEPKQPAIQQPAPEQATQPPPAPAPVEQPPPPPPPETELPPWLQPPVFEKHEAPKETVIQQPESTEPPKPQEPIQPPTEQPSSDQQEPAPPPSEQAETNQPVIEEPEKAPSETEQAESLPEDEVKAESEVSAPKKKGVGRRLRKSIMGY